MRNIKAILKVWIKASWQHFCEKNKIYKGTPLKNIKKKLFRVEVYKRLPSAIKRTNSYKTKLKEPFEIETAFNNFKKKQIWNDSRKVAEMSAGG